jgi:serine protease AprX
MHRLWKFAAPCALVAMIAIPLGAAPAQASSSVAVIVRDAPGTTAGVAQAITALGGTVTANYSGLDELAANVPSGAVASLASVPGVVEVTTNGALHLLSDLGAGKVNNSTYGPDAAVNGKSALDDPGSLYGTDHLVNADQVWKSGDTGQGVDVAVIDSGVSPVAGLDAPGKIVYGPDLSFDSQSSNLQYLDGYGHGTHMAGIIAAHDNGVDPQTASSDAAIGIAPDSRIVSVKVAAGDGSTDVSQVIAGINWVVEHAHDGGLNIRVINLSFGTNSTQSYLFDPITYATEVAWRNGIVVVVAAGNNGVSAPLDDPAYDPYVIAVGSSDHHGTVSLGDDSISDFSSRGTWSRRPDLAAPGRSIASLRDPGSYIDVNYPTAQVGTRYFRGSGTSQATAVTSGAVALLLQSRPWLTPDEVKQALVRSAAPLSPDGIALDKGIGRLDVAGANRVVPVRAQQFFWPATGLGSIDAARGTNDRLADNGVVLSGEQDVQGQPWHAWQWAADASALRTWSGGWWNGTEWTGSSWTDGSWSTGTWDGRTWSGRTWSGHTWSGHTWSGHTWSGHTWSGHTWSGRTWSGAAYE